LTASQVCVGDANSLEIAVYCDEAGLHWRQEAPNTLTVKRRDRPDEVWHDGANRAYLSPDILAIQRTPGGHPEGYLEAFANIYAAFGAQLRGGPTTGYATIEDTLAGMKFIRACLESHQQGSVWVTL
jgi:predicted dehydrogenase